MKQLARALVFFSLGCALFGQIRLPESRRLAGPLNPAASNFGDEFFNFPAIFEGRAEPGSTFLSGWIRFEFEEPEGGFSRFQVHLDAVGTPDGIAFPGGQTFTLLDNRAFTNPGLRSGGRLNLQTGEIDKLELHAIFQNSVIARVTKNIRIPFGFINDYPPAALPIPLPFDDRPSVFEEAQFHFAADGTIVGFEFHGETIAPVTLFPRLGVFPPYSFGEDDRFYFANPTGCLPGAPPENCINDENNPDGIRFDSNVFFHPHLDLTTRELREAPIESDPPDCATVPAVGAAGLFSSGGRLFLVGGLNFENAGVVQVFDPTAGQWSIGAPLPLLAAKAQGAAAGSQLFLMGGEFSDGGVSNQLHVFDIDSGIWSELEPAPAAVHSGVSATAGDRIHWIGGWEAVAGGGIEIGRKVQIYDISADRWSLGSDLPAPVADAAAVTVGDTIYVINGLNGADSISNQVWIYDTQADSWQPGPPTAEAVYGAAAGFAGGRIYLAGGRSQIDGPTLSSLQVLDPLEGVWRSGLEMPLATAESSGVAFDGKFYAAGGRNRTGLETAPGRMLDAVQIYDPAGGWSVCDSRPIFSSADVLNVASGVAGPVDLSPGARAAILGSHLADTIRAAPKIRILESGYTTDYPFELGGVRVLIDGHPAPLFSVSPDRVEFQIPYSVEAESASRRMAELQVQRSTSTRPPSTVEIPILAAAPSIFVYNYGELKYSGYLDRATAQGRNEDGRINHPDRPAAPGEAVTLYLTGLGLPFPPLEDGQRARQDPANQVIAPIEAEVGGLEAEVEWAAAAPHEAGIYEVRIRIPQNAPLRNNVPVRIRSNAIVSNVAHISLR